MDRGFSIVDYGINKEIASEETLRDLEDLNVELKLDLGNAELQTIVVRIDRLSTMPMTVATFFHLLEVGLYTGTPLYPDETMGNADAAASTETTTILHGSSLPDNRRQLSSQRWAAHGYNPESPLLWANEATARQAPCGRFGFGLDWHAKGGGDFFIQLGLSSTTTVQRPCLGRVIAGMSLLGPTTRGTLAHGRVRSALSTGSGTSTGDEL